MVATRSIMPTVRFDDGTNCPGNQTVRIISISDKIIQVDLAETLAFRYCLVRYICHNRGIIDSGSH